ncbi:MAG: hypothetical protein HQK79_11080 [Desulfobacterales bacterium]|nr:hypothetical protein [Desulfobacterales bacterium]
MPYYYGGYPEYVSVAEKKAKALRKLKELQKKNPNINPITISSNSIANTWWGKSWNKNLERYADYTNRIERGRSYVKNNAVLDLQILPGKITSLVQGRESTPYSITITISELNKTTWEEVKKGCEGRLESLAELLSGKFPKALEEIFMAKGSGLFPSPKEIEFDCSCPDWASLCKHVAATLYGVGARLDQDPSLFFKLRKVDMNELIKEVVSDQTKKLLEKAEKKTSRVIDESKLSNIFGIEMEPQNKKEDKKKDKKETTKIEKTTETLENRKKLLEKAEKKTSKVIDESKLSNIFEIEMEPQNKKEDKKKDKKETTKIEKMEKTKETLENRKTEKYDVSNILKNIGDVFRILSFGLEAMAEKANEIISSSKEGEFKLEESPKKNPVESQATIKKTLKPRKKANKEANKKSLRGKKSYKRESGL